MSDMVSCLMVTCNRMDLARRSVACFEAQQWADKELVIVDDGHQDYTPMLAPFIDRGLRIRYHRIERRESVRLGELRNLSLSLADSEWCMQWDDDEWYHPERIRVQMAARGSRSAVALKWTLMHLESPQHGTLTFRSDSGVATPGTILHRRDAARYPNLSRNEDGVYLAALRKQGMFVLGEAHSHLFVRCFHGGNTWDEQHFLSRLHRRPQDWWPYLRAKAANDLTLHPAFALDSRELRTVRAMLAYRSEQAVVT